MSVKTLNPPGQAAVNVNGTEPADSSTLPRLRAKSNSPAAGSSSVMSRVAGLTVYPNAPPATVTDSDPSTNRSSNTRNSISAVPTWEPAGMVNVTGAKVKSEPSPATLNASEGLNHTVRASDKTGHVPGPAQNIRAVTRNRTVPSPSPTSLRSKDRLIRLGARPASPMVIVVGIRVWPPEAVPEINSDSAPSTAVSALTVTVARIWVRDPGGPVEPAAGAVTCGPGRKETS